jgi:signal peptidase II
MNKLQRLTLIVSIVMVFIGCDQTAKSIARQELKSLSSLDVMGSFIRLEYAENEGGFLSIGSGLPAEVRETASILLALIVISGFFALLYYADRLTALGLISCSLLVAGALGNLIDRLLNQGRVVDFLVLGTDKLHTGVFNVADVLLMVGSLMLLVEHLMKNLRRHSDIEKRGDPD